MSNTDDELDAAIEKCGLLRLTSPPPPPPSLCGLLCLGTSAHGGIARHGMAIVLLCRRFRNIVLNHKTQIQQNETRIATCRRKLNTLSKRQSTVMRNQVRAHWDGLDSVTGRLTKTMMCGVVVWLVCLFAGQATTDERRARARRRRVSRHGEHDSGVLVHAPRNHTRTPAHTHARTHALMHTRACVHVVNMLFCPPPPSPVLPPAALAWPGDRSRQASWCPGVAHARRLVSGRRSRADGRVLRQAGACTTPTGRGAAAVWSRDSRRQQGAQRGHGGAEQDGHGSEGARGCGHR